MGAWKEVPDAHFHQQRQEAQKVVSEPVEDALSGRNV
jgi:hypothetical protein